LKTHFEPGTLPNLVDNTITRPLGIVKNQPTPHLRFSHPCRWFSGVAAVHMPNCRNILKTTEKIENPFDG
jgi:hypothetical protein